MCLLPKLETTAEHFKNMSSYDSLAHQKYDECTFWDKSVHRNVILEFLLNRSMFSRLSLIGDQGKEVTGVQVSPVVFGGSNRSRQRL